MGLLRHYQSSLSKALLSTYPFIGLEEVRFSHYAPSSKGKRKQEQRTEVVMNEPNEVLAGILAHYYFRG